MKFCWRHCGSPSVSTSQYCRGFSRRPTSLVADSTSAASVNVLPLLTSSTVCHRGRSLETGIGPCTKSSSSTLLIWRRLSQADSTSKLSALSRRRTRSSAHCRSRPGSISWQLSHCGNSCSENRITLLCRSSPASWPSSMRHWRLVPLSGRVACSSI